MEMNVATPAALIGDPVRAAILAALLDGRAEPASALARAAGVSPQAASNHLAKLTEGGLLRVEAQGRHRYYRLAGPEVAHAIEALAVLSATPPAISPKARALREARTCYSHLAGRLAVALAEALEAAGLIAPGEGRALTVTPAGRAWLLELGVPADRIADARRCLDWTERRWHIAGPLGVALLGRLLELGWVAAGQGRAVRLTPAGRRGLEARLQIVLEPPQAA